MKVLKIIVTTLVILGGLIYFAIWFTFRTTSEDVSHLKPFSEIVGKELASVQTCHIALNYEHWVKENQYIVYMRKNSVSAKSSNRQELPVGTILKIKEAKRYTAGFTGSKSTYILGTVFLEELQEEVAFEFAWGKKNFNTDLPGDYFAYNLAPWQKVRLDVMYDYDKGIEVPYENNNVK